MILESLGYREVRRDPADGSKEFHRQYNDVFLFFQASKKDPKLPTEDGLSNLLILESE